MIETDALRACFACGEVAIWYMLVAFVAGVFSGALFVWARFSGRILEAALGQAENR